jgi:ATP-binding cassette subfamily C exporter for protease/lipase
VIVLDEPNANLDEAGEAALIKAVADLKARGRTVFVITHRLNVLTIADRIVVLANGVVQADGPRDKVIAALRGPGRETPGSPAMAYQPA